jgi:hypothetical protein
MSTFQARLGTFMKGLTAAFVPLWLATGPLSADVITDWNENGVTFATGRMAPAAGLRMIAIMHVAMFDAVNSIERRYRPYLVQLPADAATSKEAAAAAAAGAVLEGLYPDDAKLKAIVAS